MADGFAFGDGEEVVGEGGVGEGGVLFVSFAEDEEVGVVGFGFGEFEGLDADGFLFFEGSIGFDEGEHSLVVGLVFEFDFEFGGDARIEDIFRLRPPVPFFHIFFPIIILLKL